MSDDLVKRLRNYDEFEQDRDGQIICQKCEITQEAADCIKQLTAERDRSEDELYELQQTCITLRGENETLTAERDRLREALLCGRRLWAIAQDDRIRLLIQLEQCEGRNE